MSKRGEGNLMKNKKILQLYTPQKIDEAIKICDNLFYGDYLESGELKTRAELKQHIKDEIAQTFIQFWGYKYADELLNKIAESEINFVYQIDGLSNTVNAYLVDLKSKRFNERYNCDFAAPLFFQYVAKMLSGVFVNPVKKLQKLISTDKMEYSLFGCLDQLNIDKDKVLNDKEYAKSVVEQIKTLGQQVKKVKYSDNPEVHRNILSLELLVRKVERNIAKECKRRGVELREALFHDTLGMDLDPLVARMELDENAKVMLTEQEFLGLQSDDGCIYFGIRPDDITILHEFVHQVEDQGFEKNHKDWVKLTYAEEMRQNQIFNEVITDYFAMLMKKQRLAEGKSNIVCNTDKESLYSLLFEKMEKFLQAYLPELKAVRLREHPAEEFARIIGQENFNSLSILCNELIAVKHDLEVCESLKENEQNFNDLMAQSGVALYGSMDYFMAEMERLEECANYSLDKAMRHALSKQPLTKKIDLFLASQSENIAEHLEGKQKLSKLAPFFTNASIVLKDKARKIALKKLKAPLQREYQNTGTAVVADANIDDNTKE